ncbi:Bug family tripartite tricarboxylate transporter substrate binding protein [Ramlibacter albus]|uniref:Tripartite tricarboxylate transporter substrate binding protein n=1 Tax=Ramlibacter albus TaxID=2079448 RepID=A0A923M7B2_9BURK|nr:tripartite tricarboxylate transporter substrate binding protein [Ramlibacter albus]MBC5763892.1 tripartite tricarboxylate transporter substrate binding protein [Ramlibacter albus]
MQARIPRRTFLAAAIGAPFMAPGLRAAEAAWPQRPIRVVMGFPGGSQTEAFARAYGEYVTQQTGQPWYLDFKPGMNGGVGAAELKRAAPDGHTLLFTITTTLIQNRVLYRSLPYDPDKDLSVVAFMPGGNLTLSVSTTRTGATNLREFVDHVRKSPKPAVGTFGPGTHPHILFHELNRQYGLDMNIVHYKGSAQMLMDLGAGIIDAGITNHLSTMPFVQKGVARAIATIPGRSPVLPGVASLADQGATSPAVRIAGYQCCLAPGGTPPEVVERISTLFQEAGRTEKMRTLLATFGADQPAYSAEESRRRYAAEMPMWLALIKELALTPE